ncbi:LysM peptidoglycan-binding domain-containing protein [Bacillus sp. Marseille-P3661]|uniref:LysM peptidoglycan-binding domain-containing protein n=1 Tax=Bacillus sp. Marseille-P3661 TaxID=1936234 RepID=UPI000C84B2F4|nr:LysM peptidoglycan-binding domain-containing protein [Bacillus sp. Marseille-P3661]
MLSKKGSSDQAGKLRKQMKKEQIIKQEITEEKTSSPKLPPRREIHRKKNDKKTKFKIRFPIVRLLAFIFLLIVVLVPGYHYWKGTVQPTNQVSQVKNETIDIIEFKNEGENQPHRVVDEFILEKPNVEGNAEPNTIEDNPIKQETQVDTSSVKTLEGPESNENQNIANVEQVIKDKKPSEPQYIIHVVQPDETLYRISMKYFKSRSGEQIIKKVNKLNSDGTVYSGQRLKIPTNSK